MVVTGALFLMVAMTGRAQDYGRVSCGSSHVLAVRADGTVSAWGHNGAGALGTGDTGTRLSPASVVGLTDAVGVSGGNGYSAALTSDGTLWTWGHNVFGMLGDGTTETRLVPTESPSLTGVAQVSVSVTHGVALACDGTVWAWGRNARGEIGDGTTEQRLAPVLVSGLTDVVEVAAGSDHSVALRADGTVWVWGDNYQGQLGRFSVSTPHVPTQVPGLPDITGIATGNYHVLALAADGSLWAWGRNTSGQLGDGGTTNRFAPTMVSGLSDVAVVAGGSYHSLAIDVSGQLWSWGWNFYGQLGDGTTTNSSVPVAVPGMTDAVAVAGGYYHTVAARADGSLWSWGGNFNGYLGDGTTAERHSPGPVPGVTVHGGSCSASADADGDGIGDAVDVLPFTPSDDFSDESTGGTTHGFVHDAGDQVLRITEAADPYGVNACVAACGGPQPAELRTCGPPNQKTFLPSGAEVLVSCFSYEIEVVRGSADLELTAEDGRQATAFVPSAHGLHFDPEEFTFEALPDNPGPVTIVVEGTEILLEPGTVLLPVAVDVKPGSCTNPLNTHSRGVLPVALLAGLDVEPADVDPASVHLLGVPALRAGLEDVAAPTGGSPCHCPEDEGDGWDDLTVKFDTQDVVAALGDVEDGEVLVLPVTAKTWDGSQLVGTDCVRILKRPR